MSSITICNQYKEEESCEHCQRCLAAKARVQIAICLSENPDDNDDGEQADWLKVEETLKALFRADNSD